MPWQKGQSGNPRGRPKGSLNKLAISKSVEVSESGQLPTDFLVDVYRDESLDMRLRVDAAKAAAPYLQPQLNASELDIKQDRLEREISDMTDAELLAIVDGKKSA